MAKKLRFLLFDADVVIEAWRRGVWRHMLTQCHITLVDTVVDEACFFEEPGGTRQAIDLAPDITSGAVRVETTSAAQLQDLVELVPESWRPELHPGEAASLAWMLSQSPVESWLICSADHIVFRILGKLGRSECGVSLEELLELVGRRASTLARHFTKEYRVSVSRRGFADGLAR
ncbi:MAG: hypothetical protein HUU15_09425 [Candidatus Brocadiae bacterium]|nr:hypothetical protein [Candidatus Brocadiia bacterium]